MIGLQFTVAGQLKTRNFNLFYFRLAELISGDPVAACDGFKIIASHRQDSAMAAASTLFCHLFFDA